MNIYRSRFLVRGEVWYDAEPDARRVDWILYRQRSQPVPGTRWKDFHTLLVELTPSPEALLEQMSKSTAAKIKRARNSGEIGCEWQRPVATEKLDGFEQMYNQFAANKGLKALNRRELEGMNREGELELGLVKDNNGTAQVGHAYYHGISRSCFLYSASLYPLMSDSAARNGNGRANVYLFWSSMLRHREQGLRSFDFGGWYPGTADQGLLGINRFKEGFGGRVVREYNCEQIMTIKGWVALRAARWLERARNGRTASSPHTGARIYGTSREQKVSAAV